MPRCLVPKGPLLTKMCRSGPYTSVMSDTARAQELSCNAQIDAQELVRLGYVTGRSCESEFRAQQHEVACFALFGD